MHTWLDCLCTTRYYKCAFQRCIAPKNTKNKIPLKTVALTFLAPRLRDPFISQQLVRGDSFVWVADEHSLNALFRAKRDVFPLRLFELITNGILGGVQARPFVRVARVERVVPAQHHES